MARGDDITVIVQAVDLKFIVSVDRGGPLRFGDEVFVTDELVLSFFMDRAVSDNVAVTDELVLSAVMERPFADEGVVTDTFARSVVYNLAFNDEVEAIDALSATGGDNLGLNDTAGPVVDAGFLTRYDYGSADYFLTPADYVGETRVF